MSSRMGDELALALALEGRGTAVRVETRRLVVLAEQLAELPEPEIDAAFAAALEARLLSEGLEAAPARPHLAVVPEPARRPEPVRPNVVRIPRRRLVVRRSVVAATAAAMLAAFPIAAAASSVPGSPFYGAKRTIERIQLRLFGTPTEDAFTQLGYAGRRIDEAAQVSALGGNPASLLREAETTTRNASGLLLGSTDDPATLERFAGQLGATADKMDSLRPMVRPEAEGALERAIEATRLAQETVTGVFAPVTVAPAPAAPAAESVPAPAVDTVSGEGEATGGSGGQSSDGTGSSSGSSSDGSSQSNVSDPTGGAADTAAKNSKDAGRYCYVPGSAEGFGDLGAPLTRVLCG